MEGAVQAKMRNIGQACTAANRFHVQAGIAPAFTRRLTDRFGSMTLGRGTEDGVEVGPLIDRSARDKVVELVDDAVGQGATVATGGRVVDGQGYFTTEEGVAAANATEYGLPSYVFTRDIARAMRVCDALEAGMTRGAPRRPVAHAC